MQLLRMKEELFKIKGKVLAQEGTIGQELDSVILVGPFLLRVCHNSMEKCGVLAVFGSGILTVMWPLSGGGSSLWISC